MTKEEQKAKLKEILGEIEAEANAWIDNGKIPEHWQEFEMQALIVQLINLPKFDDDNIVKRAGQFFRDLNIIEGRY